MAHENDRVVLVDQDGSAVGSALRTEIHDSQTPVHLAFSCYLVDDSGRFLVTRRALTKLTWPGVWTNSVCGHPLALVQQGTEVPEVESFTSAIERRAAYELGCRVTDIAPILPDFHYRATDASGIVEHEKCPVFRATFAGPLQLNPDEVMDHAWVDPNDLAAACAATPWAFSPWMVEQVAALTARRGLLSAALADAAVS